MRNYLILLSASFLFVLCLLQKNARTRAVEHMHERLFLSSKETENSYPELDMSDSLSKADFYGELAGENLLNVSTDENMFTKH